MFRDRFPKRTSLFKSRKLAFAAVLLAFPCAMLAQHGHGAGGASSAGGGGIDSIGRPTGVDQKDDLKDFHEALAVQATDPQIAEYKTMIKSTAAAIAELQSFLGQLEKKDDGSALANRQESVEQAVEKARTENRNYLGSFSAAQKSGLKEAVRKLARADSELGQRAQEFKQKFAETNRAQTQVTIFAENLDRALANFESQQASLGEEMGIVDSNTQESVFNIAPVNNSISFRNQPVAIVTSGVISRGAGPAEGPAGDGQQTFALELTEDFSDLQQNIAGVLRAQLNTTVRCGERIAIQDAAITALVPASVVFVRLHFERWSCFGGANNEIAEGDGTLEVKLTPAVADDGTLRLAAATGRINAQGLLGESLREGSLGEDLRDKIADCILMIVRQGGDFKATLPPAAQAYAKLRRTQFQSTGAGVLVVRLEGEIRVSNENATALIGELQHRASSTSFPSSSSATPSQKSSGQAPAPNNLPQ